jgi:acyl carrier protein
MPAMPASPEPMPDLAAELTALLRAQINLDDAFTARTDLSEAGVDSLAMVRVLVAIEEKYGVWLEGEDLTPENLKTVESLAGRLREQLASRPASP